VCPNIWFLTTICIGVSEFLVGTNEGTSYFSSLHKIKCRDSTLTTSASFFCLLPRRWSRSTRRSVHRTTNLAINKWTSNYISIDLSTIRLTHIERYIDNSIGRPVDRHVARHRHQPVDWHIDLPVDRPSYQPIDLQTSTCLSTYLWT
jgi:hypothetical protein